MSRWYMNDEEKRSYEAQQQYEEEQQYEEQMQQQPAPTEEPMVEHPNDQAELRLPDSAATTTPKI